MTRRLSLVTLTENGIYLLHKVFRKVQVARTGRTHDDARSGNVDESQYIGTQLLVCYCLQGEATST